MTLSQRQKYSDRVLKLWMQLKIHTVRPRAYSNNETPKALQAQLQKTNAAKMTIAIAESIFVNMGAIARTSNNDPDPDDLTPPAA